MTRDRSEFWVQIRRLSMVSIRISYRWICNHPFLVGFVCLLVLLYRTCPFMFSLLLSASPVLVCTAVLLGTLLSFGQPNIPEIEKEPEVVHEAAPLKTEVARDATVVERNDESFMVERFVNKETDVLEDGNDCVARLGESQVSEVEEDIGPLGYMPLVDETLDETKRENQVRFEEKAFVLESDNKKEIVEEKLMEDEGNHVFGGEQQMENRGSFEDMMDNSKEEQMDTSPVSPWRPMRHDEDDEDDADRDDSLDSGSDGAESSSPDASMTDIIPMLDELHPLLNSEAPHTGNLSREGSDAASEGPHRSSSDEGLESDPDSEEHGEEGDNENDDEDEEDEEEETKDDKEDESKSAIKWTEDDQKNLQDLGSLELERNQRLENLIARRRARQNTRLVAERNLIDLESADIPFNVPPISTARHNPFDLPYDSYDDMGLPPIPGSAPSILLPRRNPFDLPYEPNEEKPDLKGDSFQEEFSAFHPKEPVFRRHESFSVGPSTLGGPRQDRHDRLRPFFVLERLANEGTSYYAFERQRSELSESKVSSVPDTESVSTGLEEDNKNVNEHDGDRETGMPSVDLASDHDERKTHLSEDIDFSEQTDNRNIHHDVAEITLGGVESHCDDQSNLREEVDTYDKREPVEEDNSDSESSLSDKEEKIPAVREEETSMSLGLTVDRVEESDISAQPPIGESEMHLTREVEDVEQHLEAPAEESFITAQPSLEESEIHALCGLEDDHHHKEPVYDSSPPSASRFPSFSSVSSDNQGEIPGKGGKQVGEAADKEPEVYSESIDHRTSGLEEVHSGSAMHAHGEIESRTREVGETGEHVVREVSLSAADAGFDGQNDAMVSGPVVEHASIDPSSLPLDKDESNDHRENHAHLSVSRQEVLEEIHEDVKETVDNRVSDNNVTSGDLAFPTAEEAQSARVVEHVSTQETCSPLDTGHTREHETALEETSEVVRDKAETSGDRSIPEGVMHPEEEAQKQKGDAVAPTFDADIPVDSYSTLSSGAVEYVETHSFNDDDVMQSEQYQVRPSTSDAKEASPLKQAMDMEVDSVNTGYNVPSEETSPSESGQEPTWSDKSVVEQSTLEHSEDQEPTQTGRVGVVFARTVTFHEYHDAEDTTEVSCLTSDTSSPLAESPEYKTPMVGEGTRAEFFDNTVYEELDHISGRIDPSTELHAASCSPPEVIIEEADEIKEIDEGLLSELDTVGDFSVKEVMTDSEAGPSTRDSDIVTARTEALPVLEARSVEDIESAFQQIHEGTEIEEVILPSTIVDQVALDGSGSSVEAKSELTVVEARTMEDIDTAMRRVSGESTDEQPKSPESEAGSAEIKYPVETDSSASRLQERSRDDTRGPLDNAPEEEEARSEDVQPSDVPTVEVRTLEELQEPSAPKDSATEVKSEGAIPVEGSDSSHVTSSSVQERSSVVADEQRLSPEEEVKDETVTPVEANIQNPGTEETSKNSGSSVSEQKGKEKSKSGSSSLSSSSSSSSSDSE